MRCPVPNVRLSAPASGDFNRVIGWSANEFGISAARRYKTLIEQAVEDIGQDPFRSGARLRTSSKIGLYTYHLAGSRDRVAGDRVKRPRHFLLYQVFTAEVEVLRILHDRADLAGHLREM